VIRRLWPVGLVLVIVVAVSIRTVVVDNRRTDGTGEPPQGALPNIVVILTDDMRLDELSFMPTVQSELVEHGVRFTNAFVVNPLCCPSRASILTGQYSHTTRVYTNIVGQLGAWPAFRPHEDDTVATRLTDRYETALVGKYLNSYQATGSQDVPPGWDDWVAFTGLANGGAYEGYSLIEQGPGEPATITPYGEGTGPDTYSTDVLAAKAEDIITRNRTGTEPLFLLFSTFAPHSPSPPAKRHESFRVPIGDDPAARFGPAFNEPDVSDKPEYVSGLPLLSPDRQDNLLEQEKDRIRTLQAVDEAVGGLIDALGPEASNTLFLFTSDNGVEQGEHRWPTKNVPYEESIHMPFVIRYDPLAARGTNDAIVGNIDIAPTALDVAGGSIRGMDGASVIPLLDGSVTSIRKEILIEHLSYRERGLDAPTYCAIRTKNELFVHYATGEEELYNLNRDPYELQNLREHPGEAAAVESLRERTRALCSPRPPGMPRF
jgi:N-acetylglucosamine-6-sulfatase